MTHAQLSRDLDAAVSDAETHARAQISVAIGYLLQGLNFAPDEIRALLDEILREYPERPRLFVVSSR